MLSTLARGYLDYNALVIVLGDIQNGLPASFTRRTRSRPDVPRLAPSKVSVHQLLGHDQPGSVSVQELR